MHVNILDILKVSRSDLPRAAFLRAVIETRNMRRQEQVAFALALVHQLTADMTDKAKIRRGTRFTH